MIRFYRIKAYILRHLYEIAGSIDRKFDVFLFPTIDLLVLGLLTSYIEKFNVQNGIGSMIIGGVILWSLVYNIQRDISFCILEDAWSRSLFNMLASPLKMSEMIIGTLILSVVKALLTVAFMLFLAFSLFHFNIFQYGWIIGFYIFTRYFLREDKIDERI